MKKLHIVLGILGFAAVLITGCNLIKASLSPDVTAPSVRRYTAYNIWYERVNSVWSTNYKTGMVIPAGTEVTNVKIGTLRNHPVLAFTVPDLGNTEFMVHFNTRHHGNLTFTEFKNKMLTTKNFKELTKGFTAKEIKAIKSSRPYICKGMSKKAAIVAFGYPPEVSTPSTKLNTWKYWINRYRTVLVHFDDHGKASAEVLPL